MIEANNEASRLRTEHSDLATEQVNLKREMTELTQAGIDLQNKITKGQKRQNYIEERIVKVTGKIEQGQALASQLQQEIDEVEAEKEKRRQEKEKIEKLRELKAFNY